MAFCPNCGAEVEGRYCAKCGKAVDSSAAPVTVQPAAAGLTENTAAALCYLLGLITGIVFLVLEPYNKNKLIRFHAFQSIFLNVAVIIAWWALDIVLPWGLWWRMSWLLNLACVALWVYMLVKTYQGTKVALPVIGDLAAKQA
ncbi:MAG TPA: hypothetical protein VMI94_04015 [Bryobacteraceae bacterium]|nr:hypothetical protein [Bryobacteraceae bacterium]